MRPGSIATVLSIAIAGLCATSNDARANGKFPAADQLVVAPNDPSFIAARTTFGFLVTKNAGADWDLVCESGAGYQDIEPGIAITGDGTLFTGLFEGVSVAHGDLCDWSLTMEGIATDVSISKSNPATAIAITRDATRSHYFESADHGDTFAPVGAALPEGFFAVTVDVAPTDPRRIYMSGFRHHESSATQTGVFARSEDHGETWTFVDVPGTDETIKAFIGAMHPTDPDRLYMRLSKTPGGLLVTDDGGDTWTAIDTGVQTSELRGLAVSPDGTKIAIGGEYDGVWIASTEDFVFQKMSEVAIRCLTWSDAGLYACVNEKLYGDGFIIGLSTDEGASFEPLLELACVRGPLTCDPGTSVATSCPAEWPGLADRLDAGSCHGVGGDASSGAGGDDAGTGGAPPTAGTGGTLASTASCSVTASERDRGDAWPLLLLAAAAPFLRRSRRRAHPTR